MGKKKVGKKEDGEFKQYGRNELIERYLWFAYLESLPPGVAPDPQLWLVQDRREKDPKKKPNGRKKVSSHIQVLKGFFKGIPCCKCLQLQPTMPLRFGSGCKAGHLSLPSRCTA